MFLRRTRTPHTPSRRTPGRCIKCNTWREKKEKRREKRKRKEREKKEKRKEGGSDKSGKWKQMKIGQPDV